MESLRLLAACRSIVPLALVVAGHILFPFLLNVSPVTFCLLPRSSLYRIHAARHHVPPILKERLAANLPRIPGLLAQSVHPRVVARSFPS